MTVPLPLRLARWAAIAILLAFTLIPIYWILVTGFRPDAEVLTPELSLFPRSVTLGNYQGLIAKADIGRFLSNSVVVAIVSTLLSVGLALPAAYALERLPYPGKLADNVSLWVLSTRFIPPFAIALPLFIIFRDLRLLDTRTGLIIAHTIFSLPFALWILQSGFREVPLEIEEAARVDGCDRWQIFARIAVPLATPSIFCAAIFALLLSWNEFLFALLLTVNEASTLPLLVARFVTDRSLQWGSIAAAATIASVPVMLFLVFGQRYLVRGLTAGAVK
jgi:multiple sugar transport system permease protein